MERFDADVLAYCLMGNHYHFVVQTRRANLSRLMRQINGVYTQTFNRRHAKVGHLFQGRFHAILVDRDAYLLEVCRYVELNPVRVHAVADPADWHWSSYRAHTGQQAAPRWLDTGGLHAVLLGREVLGQADRGLAAARYADLVAAGRGAPPLWDAALRQQIYLGDDGFVERMQDLVEPQRRMAREVPRPQRSKPASLDDWLAACASRDEALLQAHTQSGLTMSSLAQALGLSVAQVSRLIAQAEKARDLRTRDGLEVYAKDKT